MSKDTILQFGTSTPRESPDMIPKEIFEQGAWLGSRDLNL